LRRVASILIRLADARLRGGRDTNHSQGVRMRLKRVMMIAIVVGLAGLLQTGAALAQQEDPIAPFVIDVRGAFMSLDAAGSAGSVGLDKALLPSNGLGLEVGAHVYPLRGRVVSLGVGASLLFVRSSKAPEVPEGEEPDPDDPTVRTRVKGFSPQVSLNFGSRRGYSYVSAGIGTMTRAIDATEGEMLSEVTGDTRARTLNYGGGARWFVNSRVAFSFDMRFYRVNAQEATTSSVSLPQQRFFAGTVGISFH
jgi:hypothetical protein